MTIQRKKKLCQGYGKYEGFGCGKSKYIFSNGCCLECANDANIETSKVASKTKKTKSVVLNSGYEKKDYSKLFNEIWSERLHISEISGKRLLPKGHPQWHWQFSHILHSGLYGKYGFPMRKDNIVLCLPEEHTIWGEKGRSHIIGLEEWEETLLKEEALKIEYNQGHRNIIEELERQIKKKLT